MDANVTYVCNMCHNVGMFAQDEREYNFPIIGALFPNDEEYVRFCARLDYYLSQEPRFAPPNTESTYAKQMGTPWYRVPGAVPQWYPVMFLDDVEIHWIHESQSEAILAKYERRLQRYRGQHPRPIFMWDSGSMMNTHSDIEYAALVKEYLAIPGALYLTKHVNDVHLAPERVAVVREWVGTTDERHEWNLLKYLTTCGDCKVYYRALLSTLPPT